MNDFNGRHHKGEIILWAIRWYCQYDISYRDLATMLTELGAQIDAPPQYWRSSPHGVKDLFRA